MSDLLAEEVRFLKNLNAKVKSLGDGKVTVEWANGRIKTYVLTSQNEPEGLYPTGSLDKPLTSEVDCKEIGG